MSQVIDPNSADSEINYVMRVSASPVATPSRLGLPLRRGSREAGARSLYCSVSVSVWNSKALSLQRCHIVVNAWNGNRVELLIKGISFISEEYPSFRV